MNAVIESLVSHRSVRKFTGKPIDPETVRTILTTGTRTATATNLQFYTFLVLDEPESLKRLNDVLEAPFIEGSNCPLAVFALADHYRVRKWLQTHSDRLVINHRPYNFFMAIWDALIALQNVVVAAESLGLGTCYIGAGVEVDIHDVFGAPDYVFPAGLVCIGHPAVDPGLSMRLPLYAVVHRNNYRQPSDDDIAAWYAERDAVWDSVAESRKEELAGENIFGIAQALAMQKFSAARVEKRSRGMLANLKRSGFDLCTDSE